MIQEAVLQLSVLRQDGAVLKIFEQDVKLSQVITLKGVVDITLKADDAVSQTVMIDREEVDLSDAELTQPENLVKAEMSEAGTQSDKPEVVGAVAVDQETQAEINVVVDKKTCLDAQVQTETMVSTESIEIQTDPNDAHSNESVKTKTDGAPSTASEQSSSGHDVEVQTVTQEVVPSVGEMTVAGTSSNAVNGNSPKPVMEEASTQTGPDDKPVIEDLLMKIGELQAQQEAYYDDGAEPGTSDGTPHRKRRKRFFMKQVSSTENSELENDVIDDDDGEDYDEDGVTEDEESDKNFTKVTKQWNKDLKSVIASLNADVNRPDKMTTRGSRPSNNVKIHATSPHKLSKRKRGRPRKLPQEVKLESSEDEEGVLMKSPEEKMTSPKKKKIFECTGCGEVFLKKVLLSKHSAECTCAAVVDPTTPHEKHGNYQCPLCDKAYTKMSHMRRHQKSHTDMREFICQFCPKAFFRKEHKDKHELTHQTLKCQFCEEVITGKANLLRHEKSHFPTDPSPKKPAKKTTPCKYCGKLFGGRAQCEQHEITHTNEKPYKCSYCDLCFSKRGNTLKHERRIHLHLKPYLCQYCGKAFAQKPDCKKHEMRHLGEKRVKCNYCDKMFLENHHRIVHERTHTGERPYKCVICNHAFAQSYDCKKHMRIHLKDKGAPKQGAPTADPVEQAKAVEYLQLQVRQAKAAVMESNAIQQQQLVAQAAQQQFEQQHVQEQAQQQSQQQQPSAPQQHLLEGPQIYPIYDYQTISSNALNPDYMMQAVAASSGLHQIAPQPPPAAVFAPHHELQATATPFMQNAFDIRKMQEMMSSQNNPENSGTKLMP